MARIKLGELLIQAGVIDQMQLDAALGNQRKWGRPLGRTLVELGMIDEKALITALSRQLNIPTVDLDATEIPPAVIRMLDKAFCIDKNCLPFRHTPKGNFLDVAMSDPTNFEVFDRIRVLTRCNVRPFLAGPFALETAIRKYYLGETLATPLRADPFAVARPDEEMFDLGLQPTRSEELNLTVSTDEMDAEAPARASAAPARLGAPQFGQELSLHTPGATPASSSSSQITRLSQEVDRLSQEVADLVALLQRDEKVIRKLMAIMVEKGLCSKEELKTRLNQD